MDLLAEGDGNVAVAAFSSYGIRPGHFQWRDILADLPVRRIFLRDPSHRWYQGPLSGMGATPIDTCQAIRREAGGRPIIAIGSSMGGFAALLFGSILRARILAFAPQTTVRHRQLVDIGDKRWPDEMASISALGVPGGLYQDALPHLEFSRPRTTVWFDPECHADAPQIRRLRSLPSVDLIETPGGHECALHLHRSGKLAGILKAASLVPA